MNQHYQHYVHWKQITLSIWTTMLMLLTGLHLWHYHTLFQLKRQRATLEKPHEINTTPNTLHESICAAQSHELFILYNALLEVMPPDVKIHKIDYSLEKTTITGNAVTEKACMHFVTLCEQNPVLHKLSLKKCAQQQGEVVFELHT